MDLLLFIGYLPLMTLVIASGLIGNGLSFVVLRKEMKVSSTLILLKLLAVADNFVLLSNIIDYPLSTIYQYSGGMFVEGVEIFYILRPYNWFFLWFSKTLSVYTVTIICTERFIAIYWPLKAASICTVRNTYYSIISLLTFSCLYNLPKLWTKQANEVFDECAMIYRPITTSTELNKNYFFKLIYVKLLYFGILHVIPYSVINFSTVFIVRSLLFKRSQQIIDQQTRGNRLEWGVAVRVLALSIVFTALELPAFIANVAAEVSDVEFISMEFTYILGCINSSINIYVYCLTGKRFRSILLRIICCHRFTVDKNRPGQ
jgi:hypothetical protein